MSNQTENNYRISIEGARLAFPNLFVAKAGQDGGEPSFSAALIIPPNHPIIPKLKQLMGKVCKDKWGDKAQVIYVGLEKSDKLALHDGATKAQYAGYEGNLFINARSKQRPTVVDRNKVPLSAEDGKPYAGCYVNALIELWAQDHKQYGKRINAQLRGIQFVRDGDAFSAGTSASEDEFSDLGDQGGDLASGDGGAPAAAGGNPWD